MDELDSEGEGLRLNWADVVKFISPSRLVLKPLERHLLCLRAHIYFCSNQNELLTVAISLTQQDRLPLRLQRLSSLHYARTTYRGQINVCRGAISPIHWIPAEILAEIFAQCHPQDHRFSRESAPLLLRQVCTLWQKIATNTPNLWNNLSFWTPPSSNTDLMCYPVHRLSPWILLSGNTTLSLFFEPGLVYHHIKLFAELILLAHFPRCQHLAFHLTEESAFGLIHFVTMPPASLVHLESLVLDGLDEAYFPFKDEGPMITVFQRSPRLRRVTTDLLGFSFVVENEAEIPQFNQFNLQVLPWAQLTHLTITDFVLAEVFFTILTECSAIRFLRVSLDIADQSHSDYQQRVILSSLTQFSLSVTGGSCLPFMMNKFDFPALQQLHFRRYQDIDSLHPLDLFSWRESQGFTHQLRNLRQLSLVGRVGSKDEVLALLRSTPSLTKLTLNIWTEYSTVIPVLFPLPDPNHHSTEFLLPLLVDLQLRIEEEDFPFPSHYIAAASLHSAIINTLSVYCLEWIHCMRDMQELCRNFAPYRLKTRFVMVDRSIRFDTDAHLIDDEDMNRSYNMF